MDPISLIVAAVAAGASAALKDTASDAIKEAYGGLKSLLRRKLGAHAEVQAALDAPEVDEKLLEQELAKTDIAKDEEVVTAAQELMAKVDPEGARAGKYVVTVTGGKVGAIGDHANVTMN